MADGCLEMPRLSESLSVLSSWLQNDRSDQATQAQLTISRRGLGEQVFAKLDENHGLPEQGLPLIASVLASFCGLSPIKYADQLKELSAQYPSAGEASWPANNALIDVASNLLGADYELHSTQGPGVLASLKRSKAWMVIRSDGSLWFGNKELSGSGAFRLQKLPLDPVKPDDARDRCVPQYRLSWDDALLECSRTLMDKPTVTIIWPDRYVTGITPRDPQPKALLSDPCVQLMTDPAYQFFHELPIPTALAQPQQVTFNEWFANDPVRGSGASKMVARLTSGLLAQPQLWLAAHRLARMCPSSSACSGPSVRDDALISLLQASVDVCPLQRRAVQVLSSLFQDRFEPGGALVWYPHGEVLMQELSSLLGTSDWKAMVLAPDAMFSAKSANPRQTHAEGTLRLWITPRQNVDDGITHDLNIYTQGPSFGGAPLRMTQELTLNHETTPFKTGDLTVTRGIGPLEHTDGVPSIYLQMSPEIDEDTLDDFESRALSQAPFWANIIHMNRKELDR